MKDCRVLLSLLGVVCFFLQYVICTEKWIVVTTIQHPTPALERLAELPDWKLVVVGDKKTPNDWSLNNCVYLGVNEQEQLGYTITDVLPWNHYARKNIGYLYAIEHGAKIIYETDDDNYIDEAISILPQTIELEEYSSESGLFNPYTLYGHESVWPRGYPLENIRLQSTASSSKKKCDAFIQQGIVHGEPDVDAIFRLTQPSNIFFNKAEPIALKSGTMCPFNSQNTLFYYDAFWALLIPKSVAFRVCDIWRGYVMQRLLWDIGGSLCFAVGDVVQKRNEHNLLHDFKDELDLYCKAGSLVAFLKNWKSCKKTLTERFKELSVQAIGCGFFKEEEFDLVHAWVRDLQKIGYTFPLVALHED